MPRGTITSYTDKTISFVEMDMAKKICKSKFQQEWVVHNLNNTFKRWVIHNLFENTYIWSKKVVDIWLSQ